MEPTSSPAGWHPDPTRRFEFRYFNGERWTADVSVRGQRFVDPMPEASTAGGLPAVDAPPRPGWSPAFQPTRPPRGMAIAAFVVGLVSCVLGWVPFVFAIAAVGAIVALIFGIIALSRVRAGEAVGKGFAISGLVLALAAFGTSFVGFQLTRSIVKTFDEFIDVGDYATTVTRCTVDGTIVEFEGTITNEDDRVHTYTVMVDYLVDGQIADSDALTVSSVAAGETAVFEGTGFARDATATSVASCRIDAVTGPTPFGPSN